MNDLQSRVKTILAGLKTHPRRRMSQNFMVSRTALAAVAGALGPAAGGTVVEVGAGLGFLTEVLRKKAGRLIAVEKDKRFCGHLKTLFATDPRVEIVCADVLDLDFDALLGGPAALVGNIPYQISSPLIERLWEKRHLWTAVALTVQKAFALRLAAPPGSPDRSALSLWVQLNADVRRVRDFGKGDFFPAPRVDSSLVELRFHSAPRYGSGEGEMIRAAIRAAFQKKRKTILNGIAGLLPDADRARAAACLEASGLEPNLRPQDLSNDDWVRLGRQIRA